MSGFGIRHGLITENRNTWSGKRFYGLSKSVKLRSKRMLPYTSAPVVALSSRALRTSATMIVCLQTLKMAHSMMLNDAVRLMSKEGVPLQYNLFTGELVDTRSATQKKADREREKPHQPMM